VSGADTDIAVAGSEAARGFLDSLERFHAELVNTEDGRHEVRIRVHDEKEVFDALDAIESYVTERAGVAARIGLDRRFYLIEPAARY
jgi:hypothetical protein